MSLSRQPRLRRRRNAPPLQGGSRGLGHELKGDSGLVDPLHYQAQLLQPMEADGDCEHPRLPHQGFERVFENGLQGVPANLRQRNSKKLSFMY